MAKFTLLQNDFGWGQMSEKTFARIDLEAYRKGVKTMVNAYPFLQGGARRRPGTRFIMELQNAGATNSMMVPLVVSSTLNALVIFDFTLAGQGKLRFLENGNPVFASPGVYYELNHPYTNDQLRAVRYVQIGRALILVHPAHHPKILQRVGTNNWTLTNINFMQFAQSETWYENADIRFKILNGFIPYRVDLGRGFGDRFTVAVNSTGGITSITKNFQDPDGNSSNNSPSSSGWNQLVAPADGTIIFDQSQFGTTVAQTYTLTCSRAQGDKTYWEVSGSVSGSANGGAGAAPPYDWKANNYPASVAWFQQRLWFGGVTTQPTKVYASTLTLYSDFTEGTNDDDALSFQIASDSYDGIVHLSAARVLLIHTFSNEFSVVGGNQSAITPTNFLVQPQTAHGSGSMRPIRVGNEILYAQRGAQRLRATSYQVAIDAYQAPDVSLFAEDLSQVGIRNGAFAQDPDFMSWFAMFDGTMTSVTLNREQNVVGWAKHTTDGTVLDVKTLNFSSFTLVYFLIKRTINGVVKLYLERFVTDDTTWTDCSQTFGDPFGPSNLNQTVLTGLDFLEGKEVSIVVDEKLHSNKTVIGGQVTLDFPMTRYAVVGLPYTTTIELLHPELGQIVNNIQGDKISPHELIIRFKDTVTCKIDFDGSGLREIPFNKLPYVAGSAIPPYTGDKIVHASGWKNPWNLKLVQDRPLPWTILGVIMKLSVNSS